MFSKRKLQQDIQRMMNKNSMYYDIAVIGGGASGLCTAIKSKTKSNKVLIIEHTDRVGKKILSTGNGRCNLTNKFCKVALFDKNEEGIYPYFTSGSLNFAEAVIDAFDCDAAIDWFEELGLVCKDVNGYVYPLSEQASSVLDRLRYAAEASGVKIMSEYLPKSIKKDKNGFNIDNKIFCKKLVLACGGKAAPKTGSDGSGYELAKKLGHNIVLPLPALCGIKCKSDCFKSLAGVRANCILRLFTDNSNKPILTTHGNVQFNSYGISGIPAMQLSGSASRLIEQKKYPQINIEIVPEKSFDELVDIITTFLQALDEHSRKILPAETILSGLMNKKIVSVILKEMKLRADNNIYEEFNKFLNSDEYAYGIKCASFQPDLTDEKIFAARCAGIIKHFKTNITGTLGFEEAQVTSGGVSTDEINPKTMESLITPGLYFTGEIIDVDGICGGYNLQWAWSTAHVAAKSLLK